MKILLCAINSKFIHTNPAIHCLKAYVKARLEGSQESAACSSLFSNFTSCSIPGSMSDISIETAEYTINQPVDQILSGIYRKKPQVLCFSCYIWNISYTEDLVREIKKVLPSVPVFLGGPEVSFDAENVLRRLPEVTGIMRGEGEATFYELCQALSVSANDFAGDGTSENASSDDESSATISSMDRANNIGDCFGYLYKRLPAIKGLTFRDRDGMIRSNPDRAILPMDELPFIYHEGDDLKNRIIYYESSRGCPFNCSYCLSSVDKHLRFRSLDKVLPELQYFLDRQVPQVKFVDRTFNCRKDHAMAIWQYLLEHDNGITNFHFEIAADLISEDELALLSRMRPGQVQLEIGIQSTNPKTISEIHRTMDFKKVADVVTQIHSFGNIHQHVDLIAGLPYEDLSSFRRSFNDVYALQGALLQLGFLKVLSGSFMSANKEAYDLICQSRPPYEVLRTRWLSYDDVLILKGIEEMVEVYYNSLQFTMTLPLLEPLFETPYELFDALRLFYEKNGLFGISHKRSARYEHLLRFAGEYAAASPNSDVGSARSCSENSHAVSTNDRADSAYISSENHHAISTNSSDGSVCICSENCHAVSTDSSDGSENTGKWHSEADRVLFLQKLKEYLTIDYYLRENAKSRPDFAIPEISDHGAAHAFYENETLMAEYLPDHLSFDARQRRKMTHLEYLPSEDTYRLFDYMKRDPLSGNARCIDLPDLV